MLTSRDNLEIDSLHDVFSFPFFGEVLTYVSLVLQGLKLRKVAI